MWKKIGVSLLLTVVAAALLSIWGVTAYVNFMFAFQQAGGNIQHAYGGGVLAVSVDILKAITLIAVSATFMVSKRRWLMAIWIGCCLWSGVSCYGYFSTMLSNTAATRTLHNTVDASLEKQLTDQVQALANLEALKLSSHKSRWADIEGQIAHVEGRIEKLRETLKTTSTIGAADPLAKNLAVLGISADMTSFLRALLFMMLLEVISNFGLWAFSSFLGLDDALKAVAVAVGAADDEPPAKTPTQSPNPTPPSRPRPTPPRPPRGPDFRGQSVILFDTMKAKHPTGEIEANAMWRLYGHLAAEHGWKIEEHKKIGQQLRNLGAKREDDGDRIHYRWQQQPNQKAEGGARLSIVGGGLS